ncbi:hypothetical protein O181_102328 [Austropuccinia psidii MF-1]|uniref:Uncharacterized protein n=1 Tax=Austropuccinia psidii MF-1 TaxID=1389203 RepID=A0A9Q3JG56_9BASI|nr:hypothetical protein [Austropuccinia psidii MF-1]
MLLRHPQDIPPYSSSSLPLTMLTLAWCPPDMPPTLPPISALITPYTSTPPPRPQDIPPTPSPTHLILFTNYHPYTLAVSSLHASDAAPTPA